ncbi:hypothetical protein D3C73_1140090 [compost metagenome]
MLGFNLGRRSQPIEHLDYVAALRIFINVKEVRENHPKRASQMMLWSVPASLNPALLICYFQELANFVGYRRGGFGPVVILTIREAGRVSDNLPHHRPQLCNAVRLQSMPDCACDFLNRLVFEIMAVDIALV